MHWRLSALMFLAYAPLGAMIPQLTVHLRRIGFSDSQIGLACATQALGALLAPLLAGQVADRWIRADRWLTICAFVAAALQFSLAKITHPLTFTLVSLAYWLMMAPVLSLTTSISFTHLPQAERNFGRIRMWGTVGWVIQGWILGYWLSQATWFNRFTSDLSDIFRLGAVLSLILALFGLTLPATPPDKTSTHRFAPVRALQLLRNRAFAIYFICNFVLCMTVACVSQTTPLLLEHLDLPIAFMGPALTMGQSMEIIALGILPLLLTRFGQRKVMLAGLLAWTTALAIQTVGHPLGLVLSALALNGLFICCFLVVGQMYVNGQASRDFRASALSLLSFVSGLGMLLGNLLTGWVREISGQSFPLTFGLSTAVAVTALVLFVVGFQPERSVATS